MSLLAILPWILSVGTVSVLWLAPTRPQPAWLLGLVIQVPWATFAILSESYGLLPLSGVLVYVYLRNFRKAREQKS